MGYSNGESSVMEMHHVSDPPIASEVAAQGIDLDLPPHPDDPNEIPWT